jgi:hypothetical protein
MGGDSRRSFGEILDDLCVHPPDRQGRYSNSELSRVVADLGGNITPGYLSLLRNGERDNPTLEVLEYLAAALDVCPAVFVGGRRQRHRGERPRQSFSRKLNHLFAVVYPPDRGPYTPEEIASAITADPTHGSISASYIRELLHPPAEVLPNPRLKHILGLAEQFGLADRAGPRAAYFLDDVLAATIDAELADFAAMRDAGVVEFVTRVASHAPAWRPELRRQVVDALAQAMESGESAWVFRSTANQDPGPTETGRQ